MNTIEFNKKYTKLPVGIKTAVLVACEPVRGQDQTNFFLKYDTMFRVSDNESWFESDIKGNCLCLVLKSDTGAIFTTLRKDNEENREKYMRSVVGGLHPGQYPRYDKEFNIIIKED